VPSGTVLALDKVYGSSRQTNPSNHLERNRLQSEWHHHPPGRPYTEPSLLHELLQAIVSNDNLSYGSIISVYTEDDGMDELEHMLKNALHAVKCSVILNEFCFLLDQGI